MSKKYGEGKMKWKSVLKNITDFSIDIKTPKEDVTDTGTANGTTEYILGRTEANFSFNAWFDDASGSFATPDSGSIALQIGNYFWSGSAILHDKKIDFSIKGASKYSLSGTFNGVVAEGTGSI